MLPVRLFDPDSPPQKRRPRRLPDFLRPHELRALFAAAETHWRQTKTAKWRIARQRDALMIQTAYYLGLRVAELCRVDIADLDLAGGLLFVRKGKGCKDRTVPICGHLARTLKEWIGERSAGVLFPDPRGRHINETHFRVRLRFLAGLAGITRRVHPHILRHAFATNLLRAGADIYEVKTLMGHDDIRTTQIYLHLVPGRLAEVVELLE